MRKAQLLRKTFVCENLRYTLRKRLVQTVCLCKATAYSLFNGYDKLQEEEQLAGSWVACVCLTRLGSEHFFLPTSKGVRNRCRKYVLVNMHNS